MLARPRYEILPLTGGVESALRHAPPEVTLTVTASPRHGIDATLAAVERLAAEGRSAVPHLSARLVRDAVHLEEILDRLTAIRVRDVFVIAGDVSEPAGAFAGAADLLRAVGERRRRFDDIGITGYPESHHLIPDETTIAAMNEKAALATYIVSQVTFDPVVIGTWIERVRARDTLLPVWVGVPGSVDRRRLLRLSVKMGLGRSARFLSAHRDWLRRLASSRRYTPTALLDGLAPVLERPAARVAGLHIYTFGEVEATERWRRDLLARLSRV